MKKKVYGKACILEPFAATIGAAEYGSTTYGSGGARSALHTQGDRDGVSLSVLHIFVVHECGHTTAYIGCIETVGLCT